MIPLLNEQWLCARFFTFIISLVLTIVLQFMLNDPHFMEKETDTQNYTTYCFCDVRQVS